MPLRPLLACLAVFAALLPQAHAAPLRYAEDQSPATLNPIFASSMSEARVHELLFDSLYTDDLDLATVGRLAQREELAPDRRSMVIHLRSDLRWHDGQPLTADDVVFTILAMKDPRSLSTEAGRVAFIQKAEALTSQSLRLTFAEPEPSPQDRLFFKIIPRHLFQGSNISRSDPFRSTPVGSGPYRLRRGGGPASMFFEAVAGHPAAPLIPELELREIADRSYQAKLLLYQSLEALVRVLPRDLPLLQASPKVELYPYQTNTWWYLGYNLQRPVLADLRVRQALSAMVDAAALLRPIGTGELVSGPFVPSSPFYNHQVAPPRRDPAQATALLTEAGCQRSGARWSCRGAPLTLKLAAPRGMESAQEVVIQLQAQLRDQGVETELVFLDEAAWKASVWRDRDFDLVLSQWTFDRNEDVREQLHSQGARNFVGYRNPEVDRLLDQARAAIDPQDKKLALREVHRLVAADAPMRFLWTLDSFAALSSDISDVVIHPFYFFTWVQRWKRG